MEHRLAQRLSDYFVDESIISQEDYEIYVYGSELLISFTISTVFIALLGLVFNRLVETLLFLTIFIVLRRYTGGYHAPSHFKCKLTTVATYLLVLGLSEWTAMNLIYYIIIFLSGCAVILSIGPIENPNKLLSFQLKRKNRLLGLILFNIVIAISSILYIEHSEYSSSILYSAFMVIIMMIVAKMKTINKKVGGDINENDR